MALDEAHPPCQTYDMCIAALGVSRATIATVVKAFCDNGIDDILKRNRSINSVTDDFGKRENVTMHNFLIYENL